MILPLLKSNLRTTTVFIVDLLRFRTCPRSPDDEAGIAADLMTPVQKGFGAVSVST